MSNTHIQPDHAAEMQAIHADLLAPAILAATWAVPGPPSMTLAPFEVYGYVSAGSPARLTYVYQAPVSLALTGGDGNYWIAIHSDTFTPLSGWTRRIGSHYLWRAAGTQPADPPGALVGLQVVVAGGVITTINGTLAFPQTRLAVGGGRGQLTYAAPLTWDGAGLSVGGTLTVLGHTGLGTAPDGINQLVVAGPVYCNNQMRTSTSLYSDGTLTVLGATGLAGASDSRFSLRSYGTSYFDGLVGIGRVPSYTFEVEGNTYMTGVLGVGTTPNGSWNIAANTILAYGQLQSSGTLYVVGATTLASSVLMQGAVTVNTGITGTGGIHVTPFVTTNQANIQQNLGAGGNADVNFALRSYGNTYFDGKVGFASVPTPGARVMLGYNKSAESGLAIQQTVADDGNASVLFLNTGGGICGTITTSSTTTSYNTTSDRRAKDAIVPLEGSVPIVQALQPVAFRWRATGEPGVGFVADEVQAVVPEAVTGTPDSATWQGMDASKLLPYVVGTLHTILTRLETLETAYARTD